MPIPEMPWVGLGLSGFGLCGSLMALGCVGCSGVTDAAGTTGGGTGGTVGTAGDGNGGNGGADGEGESGAGGQAADTCAASDYTEPWLEPLGPIGGVYSGPAVIERSTETDLVVAFESAVEGGTAVLSRRVQLSRMEPMPMLPVGAQVWLHANPAGGSTRLAYMLPPPRAFSISDGEDGPLLLGTAFNAPVGGLEVVEKLDRCATVSNICPGGQTIFQSLKVQGDSQVTIDDMGVVAVGGIDYDVRVMANRTEKTDAGCAADVYLDPAGLYWLEARATDLGALSGELERGELPSCAHGNDEQLAFGVSIYNSGVSTFEGSISYRGVDAERGPRRLSFDAPSLTNVGGGDVPFVELDRDADLFEVPSLGTEFWLSTPKVGLNALLDKEGGIPLAVSASTLAVPFEANEAAWLRTTLGVGVRAEKACDYVLDHVRYPGETPEDIALSDVIFETDPPVRAKSGTRTLLQLGDRQYDVWVWGQKYVGLVMYAR